MANTTLTISGAQRQANTGPRALSWQVSSRVEKEGELPYESIALVLQKAPRDFDVDPNAPDDQPEWLPRGFVEERVHYYVKHQLASAIEQPDGSLSKALVVKSAIVEEFDEDWNYLGTTVLTPD